MADENKPAFYPRVGNIKAKNFRSAKPMPFIDDPRAMDLPQFGDVDLSVPSRENLEMARRMAERDAQLKRQREADRSPLEKLAGGLQAGRFMGSALTQAINSLPTRIAKGDEAADKFIQERIYKPEQPLAYEYAGDIGDFLEKLETEYKIPPVLPEAIALQYLTAPATSQATRAAGRGAEQAGMAIERGMEPVVRGALEQGGLPREMAMAMGANTQANVIKPYGGNWLSGQDRLTVPENDLRRLKIDTMMGAEGDTVESLISKKDAINKWIDSNLKNYVKKEMATPDDPVRKLAEEGIIHTPLRDDLDRAGYLEDTRKAEGYPAEGMGKSDLARRWENLSDDAIRVTKASAIQDQANTGAKLAVARAELDAYKKQIDEDFIALLKDKGGLSEKDREVFDRMPSVQKAEILGDTKYKELQGNINTLLGRESGFEKAAGELNPFVSKLDPETRLYSGSTYNLGFDHIIDVLREDVAAGRIRPEQLSKVSMEQAVRRTYEYDQEMAKKMAETQAKVTEGMPLVKEYPEGYKWIELATPKLESLPEGSSFQKLPTGMMQVVDNSGKPLTVPAKDEAHALRLLAKERGYKNLEDALKYEGDKMGHCVGGYCPDVAAGKTKIYSLRDAKGEPHVTIEVTPHNPNLEAIYARENLPELYAKYTSNRNEYFNSWPEFLKREAPELLTATENKIVQIKGKGNAKPKDDYLPFVQDFVKTGNWSEIGDFKNTGLYTPKQIVGEATLKTLKDQGVEIPKYLTQSEADDFMLQAIEGMEKQKPLSDLGGMKRGGVAISNNPDAMMLELNNQKMAKGGLTKLLRAAPKSKAEIDVIARRMAPQLLGEFVRGEKGTQSVAGKTQKQFAKEKEMKHDIRPTGAERPLPKEVDIEELKDQVMVGIAGDPTISGQTLYSVDGVPLDSPSPQHGGPFYGLGRDDAFWASGLSAANRVQNVAREASEQYDLPVLGNYVMMGPDSINYAQHYADANLAAINPAKMTKAQIEDFNNLIRHGSKKSGPRPSFPGIENPSEAYLHFSIDPELRKHFNALMQMPTVTKKYNLPSGIDVRHAVTEPDLRDLEIGVTGKSIGRLRPEIKELNWSEHPTYSHDIPGEFMGSSQYPVPYELSFPDTVKSVRENPKQAPQEFGSFKYVGPRQVIDQQLIDEIKQYQEMIKKYTGKKDGGAVKKPAAFINGDEFVNAAKKYGIKDSMNNLNMIVDLVNKGLSVDDAARQVADSGMHKAAGGAIRGDDLILEERPL